MGTRHKALFFLVIVLIALPVFKMYHNGLSNLTHLEFMHGLINDDSANLHNLIDGDALYTLERAEVNSPGVWLTRVRVMLYFDQIEPAREVIAHIPFTDYQRLARFFLGQTLVEQGNIEEAVEILVDIGAELHIAELGNRWAEEGHTLIEQGDTEQAQLVWERAFKIWQGMYERQERLPPRQLFTPIVIQLSLWSIDQQDYDEAIEYLLFLLEFYPESSSVHRRIGSVYTVAGDYVLAELWLDAAIALNESDFKNYTARAELARRMGQTAEAIAYLESALMYAPEEHKPAITANIKDLQD